GGNHRGGRIPAAAGCGQPGGIRILCPWCRILCGEGSGRKLYASGKLTERRKTPGRSGRTPFLYPDLQLRLGRRERTGRDLQPYLRVRPGTKIRIPETKKQNPFQGAEDRLREKEGGGRIPPCRRL